MTYLLAASLVIASGIVLLFSGLEHLGSSSAFRDQLAQQRIPLLASRWFAPLWAIAEILLGGTLASFFLLAPGGREVSIASGAAIFSAYSVYAWWLLRYRPFAPCACDREGLTVNSGVLFRAGVLSLVCLLALALVQKSSLVLTTRYDMALALSVGAGLGAVLRVLPSSMHRLELGHSQ